MLRLLFILLFFVSCQENETKNNNLQTTTYQSQIKEIKADSLLAGIQGKIYDAFVQSIVSKNNKPLLQLNDKLELLHKEKNQNLILYWRSYLQFYSSIYYLKTADKKTAEKEIDKGIDWLDGVKNKNSEDYALLAMLQGFSIQFKRMRAMFISGKITENIKQAIAMDSTNLRAYYVYATNDFYTPEKYGGGKDAEKYLLKAISFPAQKIKNKYLPSWGKEEAYGMLINLYIKNEKWDLAKKYFREGITEFPKSYTINQLSSKFIDK